MLVKTQRYKEQCRYLSLSLSPQFIHVHLIKITVRSQLISSRPNPFIVFSVNCLAYPRQWWVALTSQFNVRRFMSVLCPSKSFSFNPSQVRYHPPKHPHFFLPTPSHSRQFVHRLANPYHGRATVCSLLSYRSIAIQDQPTAVIAAWLKFNVLVDSTGILTSNIFH